MVTIHETYSFATKKDLGRSWGKWLLSGSGAIVGVGLGAYGALLKAKYSKEASQHFSRYKQAQTKEDADAEHKKVTALDARAAGGEGLMWTGILILGLSSYYFWNYDEEKTFYRPSTVGRPVTPNQQRLRVYLSASDSMSPMLAFAVDL